MYKLTYKNFSPMLQNYLEYLRHTRWNMLIGTQKFIPNKESDNSSNSRFIKDVTLGSFLIVPLPFQKSKWRFLETTKVSLKKNEILEKTTKGLFISFLLTQYWQFQHVVSNTEHYLMFIWKVKFSLLNILVSSVYKKVIHNSAHLKPEIEATGLCKYE